MRNYCVLLDKLLDLTSFLEKEYKFTGNEAYPPFLEGSARKSYYYLYSLKQLSTDEKNGDTVIDLSRSLLESLIIIMYVQEFGKEKKSKKFLMYAPIETWGDGEYALKVHYDLSPEAIEERRKEFDTVKNDYSRPSKKEVAEKRAKHALAEMEKLIDTIPEEQKNKFILNMTSGKSDEKIINKSWEGVDLETMMNELDKKGKFPGNLRHSFERIYVYGNRKNHLSPTDINLLLDKTERIQRNRTYNMDIGLYVSLLSYTMIMIELAELRSDVQLKENLEKCRKELLSLADKT